MSFMNSEPHRFPSENSVDRQCQLMSTNAVLWMAVPAVSRCTARRYLASAELAARCTKHSTKLPRTANDL